MYTCTAFKYDNLQHEQHTHTDTHTDTHRHTHIVYAKNDVAMQ